MEVIERDGRFDCYLLVPIAVATRLLRVGSPEAQALGANIRHQVARIGYLDYWNREPQGHIAKQLPPFERVHLQHALSAASHYVAWRIIGSNNVDPSQDRMFSTLLATLLAAALGELDRARQGFETHRSVDVVVGRALGPVSLILARTAEVAGYFAASGRLLSANSFACEVLSRNGLADWLRVFERDLAHHYDRRGAWDWPELLLLGTHVDRLLWQTGIFLSPMPDGQCWIDVVGDAQMPGVLSALRA